MFSINIICLGFKFLAFSARSGAMSEKITSTPDNSCNLAAIGRSESSGLRSPLGLPRWAIITIEQLASSNFLIVDSEATIRPSSVMTPFFNGTFRSQRSKTFLF